MRVSALQVCPEFRKHFATPSVTACSRSASSRITFGDFPPSSSATGFGACAASSDTRLPARVEPVNDTMSVPRCETSASPTTGPVPVTTLRTPAGSPTSFATSASTNAFSGTTSLGFRATVQPAVSAGATFSAIWWSG